LADRGMTMIIVTHEMRFARQVSTRIAFMEAGKIVEDGLPSTIFENPMNERTRIFLSRSTN
jgi:ABC-type polar amino acid transport system ATPase subunit